LMMFLPLCSISPNFGSAKRDGMAVMNSCSAKYLGFR